MLAARPHIEPRRVAGADSVVVSENLPLAPGRVVSPGAALQLRAVDRMSPALPVVRLGVRLPGRDADVGRRGGGAGAGARLAAGRGDRAVSRCCSPGVYPLMEALLEAGLMVLLETSGAIDVRLVPAAVHKIVDVKCPGSGEADRNDWRVLESLTARDELKFVLASRADYDWAKARIAEHADRSRAGRAALLDGARRAVADGARGVDHRGPAPGAVPAPAAQGALGSRRPRSLSPAPGGSGAGHWTATSHARSSQAIPAQAAETIPTNILAS